MRPEAFDTKPVEFKKKVRTTGLGPGASRGQGFVVVRMLPTA